PPKTPAPAPGAPVDSKEASARKDLEKARAFAKEHPADLSGQLREYSDLTWKWEGTEVAGEAKREGAVVKAAILEKVAGWMAELEEQIKGLLEAKQYFEAVRKIEELKPTHDLAEWRLAAEKRASELFVLGKRMSEGEEAKKTEEKPAVPPGARPAAKPLSEEGRNYAGRWDAAAARAAARDYGGAVSDLERAAASIKDADLKLEAEEDLSLFKKAALVCKESLDVLRQKPRGGGLSIGYRDAKGEAKRAGGLILQTDAERVEIREGKGSTFIEWTDVTAATLAEIAQRGKFDPAGCTALCLLEGEAEAARAFQTGVSPKWWTWAEGARAKLPKPDPAERNARELYASAEKGYRSMETRAAAVENYKTLRTDCTSTALVKMYSERIFRRSEAGREYYFAPAEFRIDGTFRLAKSGKLESTKDSDDRDTLQNLAEIEFAVLPGLTYRCWIQVGACCEETFAFYLQGSELTDVDPKTKKKITVDPGSNFAVQVKHGIRNLKKLHDDHRPKGVKVFPKTAARWEWVEITLPKYAGPGAKKLVFMTNQAGFSIGGAILSSTRKAPPTEPEIKELDKARGLDDPPVPIDPDLVGWWAFEEGGGNQVVDLSGKNHPGKVVGSVQWVEGKIGGGLQGTGDKSGVEVADAEDLRLTGDLTLSIWVKRTAESGDWVCILGRGTAAQRNFGIWLEAGTRKYMYQQYGGADINVFGQKLIEQGKWIHLAVTIESDNVRVFYNGELDAESKRPGRSFGGAGALGIGQAMAHTGLNGAVDDVRIYSRALSADEIRALYALGK
ncbi:MAG: hypothetical protein HY293_18855, partial [Planctomycetes bacterium]|nr:hypothetical protein [Planctomycetota bacterium]